MTETIAAVLERLTGQPERFDELRALLADTALRQELLDYTDEVTRGTSARYASKELERTKFYAELVEREGRRLKGTEQLDAIREIERQFPQILQALETAMDSRDGELLVSFASNVALPLRIQGKFVTGISLFEQILGKAADLGNSMLEIAAREAHGSFLIQLDRFAEAEITLNRMYELASSLQDDKAIAGALSALARNAIEQGHYNRAWELSKKCLAIYRILGLDSETAALTNHFGCIARRQGRLAEAQKLLQESHQLRVKLGDLIGTAGCLHNLGLVAFDLGSKGKAKALFKSALEINRQTGNLGWQANNLEALGVLAYKAGEFAVAEDYYQLCLEIRSHTGTRMGKANTLAQLANLASSRGDYNRALDLLTEYLSIAREVAADNFRSTALLQLSAVQANKGCLQEAEELVLESEKISRLHGASKNLAYGYYLRAEIYLLQDDEKKCAAYLNKCMELCDQTGFADVLASALRTQAKHQAYCGSAHAAFEAVRRSLEVIQDIGDYLAAVRSLAVAGALMIKFGATERGGEILCQMRDFMNHCGISLSPSEELFIQTCLANGDSSSVMDISFCKQKQVEKKSIEQRIDYALKAIHNLQLELDGELSESAPADHPPVDAVAEAAQHDAGRDAHA